MITLAEMLLVFAFLALFSLISHYKKLLDLDGILIGNAVGIATITWGPHAVVDLFAVIMFFLVAELASNISKKKHGQRGISNVLSNSLPALVMLLLIMVFPTRSALMELAFFGGIAAAFADTMSSEVGRFSKKEPVLITTLKPTRKGIDGGITLLGESAGFFSALSIAIIFFYVRPNFLLAFVIILAGLVGTNVDSWFGAMFERKGLLNNSHVNLLGSGAGALFALIIGALLSA